MRRVREEHGFGLVELLIAMTVTAVALMTLVAALTSGTVALRTAGMKTSAAALADARMGRYRAISFSSIGLSASALT
ncbi:MAG: prepilin-type N-terminal cleavage/methylation domain-containing protein, partial [Actinomycetota bacterium]|nr:prepilin-type N-terminal cleavage/methylation domain-containing protein [Actinomycetota bacterium]